MSTNAVAKIEFSKEQLQVIESQFFPAGATKAEQQYCFSVAKDLGLNPITKEIHFVHRRQKVGDKWVNKVEPMVGRDGFLSIAHRSGQLAGMQTSTAIQEVPQLINGAWEYRPDLVAECTVWRKDSDKPFSAQVAYSEYVQKNNEGKPTVFWQTKKITMISKVAESQALRKAFNIHGVYCPEELGAGFETETGEIIEVEVIPPQSDRSRLSVVQSAQPPPQPEPRPPGPAPDSPPPIDESEWPDPPEPRTTASSDDHVSEILTLLESKNIPYDLDMETGIISAKSFHERQLLKDSGFRWNADTKTWVFKFEPDPF